MNKPTVEKPIDDVRPAISKSPQSPADAKTSINGPSDVSPTTQEEFTAQFEQRVKERAEAEERAKDEWRTPIEFYGKVVDENDQSVSGATVIFGINDLSSEGYTELKKQSDAEGFFSLTGVRGKHTSVTVFKDGYYTSALNRRGFTYAGENVNFIPDMRNPIVFHLRKKGQAEPLVASAGIFSISISGKPLEIDLKTGRGTMPGKGNLILEFYRTPLDQTKGQIYDWSFKIAVPGGGLASSTNEFDFLAPESGYEATKKIEAPASLENQWYGRLNQKYFLRLADGTYGRLLLDLMTYNGSLKIEAFINPSGSRNLEPMESKPPRRELAPGTTEVIPKFE